MRSTPQVAMLERAVEALGPLAGEMVFVGGAIVGLLLTDPAAPRPRATDDVDVIVRAATRNEYYAVEARMRERGFEQPPWETVICRWHANELTIDVVPTTLEVLGFSSRWFPSAAETASLLRLPSGAEIAVVDGPHMLATKLEAFFDRGEGDVYGSADLEDIVTLLDGRPELSGEVARSPEGLRTYVADCLNDLLGRPGIPEAIEGHLGSVEDAAGRVPTVLTRMREMI